MNDNTALSPELQNEMIRTANAFSRVFKSADGKLVYEKLINYRQGFINAALTEKDRDTKLTHMDMASGVDGVIWLIDEALRESARREEEESKKKKSK